LRRNGDASPGINLLAENEKPQVSFTWGFSYRFVAKIVAVFVATINAEPTDPNSLPIIDF
jgi:hypothetical protein